jgi:hypothetical protein
MSRIQSIFRDYAAAYLDHFGPAVPEAHRRVIQAICDCRSGECGHHLFVCPECGQRHVAKSSCGNRHCPICQNEKAAQWVYQQQLRRLPCAYFLATFTLPEALQAVAYRHPKPLYDALLDEAAASLRTLEADPRFVGCPVAGFFGVLHTWGRQLQYHPHAHFVIPGGGLSEDRTQWIATRGDFLVHVRALSALFRGKLRARLKALGLLTEVPSEVWRQDWVVHCEAVGDGHSVMKYLGAYVFRVAISDARIQAYDGRQVTFRYQKVGSPKWRHCTLSALEFMRRFLQHVLPKGFVKVRHFGFLSPNFAVPLQKIRGLICLLYERLQAQFLKVPSPPKPRSLRCPRCSTLLRWVRFFPPPRLVLVT